LAFRASPKKQTVKQASASRGSVFMATYITELVNSSGHTAYRVAAALVLAHAASTVCSDVAGLCSTRPFSRSTLTLS
jgi:hypothetical protein